MYTPRRRAKKAKKAGPLRRIRLFIALCLVVFAGLGFGYIFAAYQSLPTVSNSMRPAVSFSPVCTGTGVPVQFGGMRYTVADPATAT